MHRVVNMEPRRILLVDDDPDIRDLVHRTIGHEFPAAEIREATDEGSLNGALAGWVPDVLITDFDLRWSDGLKVFEWVKAAAPACCTVMFTGTGDEDLAVRAMKQGFDDYIVKRSSQLRRLAASVRIAYDRHRERRELTENRDLVLKELYHRLHNNLQIVVSLMRMTEKAMMDLEARQQLADLRRRIQALTALQEEFYRSQDFRRVDFEAFLEGLARNLVGLAGGRIGLTTEIASTHLTVDVAAPLGLIANELITNVLKHAFPESATGNLLVSLEQQAGELVLTIKDDGEGSRGKQSSGGGLGARLIERLAEQIGAGVEMNLSDAGVTCTVRLPS
ncbi:sensor histidine kinase [Salinarimonas soli]|uniref:sensor histidine kinase n=1 Tax=Salinarimonas soli TaxID=1638099 RepID=UPI0016619563|nr:histidine kinase dimerization/phosphoacceptor domain -containing protein [Salinarimonas soli]